MYLKFLGILHNILTASVIAAPVIGVLLIILSFFGGLMPHYSTGDRSGVVIKMSTKGVLFTSYEGQAALGGMAPNQHGAMTPVVWSFSLPPGQKGLAEELSAAAASGKRVVLTYREYLIRPVWLSTGYVITKVAYTTDKIKGESP